MPLARFCMSISKAYYTLDDEVDVCVSAAEGVGG